MILLAVIGLLLVAVIFFSLEKANRYSPKEKGRLNGRKTSLPCPLCGSTLVEGERIRSVAFDLGRERLMHIYGCPYCEKPGAEIKRLCPVCKKVIPAGGFAVGRMWEKIDKTHLHIVGCTVCKPQYKTH